MIGVRRMAKLCSVVVVAMALGGCSSAVPSSPFSDTITVTARFDNASGMYVGNTVSVLGMRVGRVDSIDARGDHVDVTMSLDGSVSIPADAQAVTITDSVLTDRHIELTPAYSGGDRLADQAVIDRDHTRTPVEFDSVLAMMDKLSTSLRGDGAGGGPVADVLEVGAASTAGNGEGIRAALSSLSDALRMGDDPDKTRDAITSIVTDLDSLTTVAAQNDATLREFGGGIGQLTDLLSQLDLGTGTTGKMMNDILARTTQIMEKNRGNLNASVNSTRTITDSLVAYNGQMAEFLDVFPLAANNFYNAIDQDLGALRVHVNLDQVLFDSQMIKEVCNALHLTQLGCATGKVSDMGPDFGVTAMLAGMAGVGQ